MLRDRLDVLHWLDRLDRLRLRDLRDLRDLEQRLDRLDRLDWLQLRLLERHLLRDKLREQLPHKLRELQRELQDLLQELPRALPELDVTIHNFERVIQLLYTQDLQDQTCVQNALLISSSCKFPRAEKPETRLALLKILCYSVRYRFMFTDPRSQPEILFTNAIQCFLSNQSEPAHLQHELNVVKMILVPFFNQEHITDRDHAPSPFELKDHGILLKELEEAGGLQALSKKYRALLRSGSATPEVLAPGTGFAHLIANDMIKTNTFDPLHLPDSAKESPFTNNLSVLIHLLLYNSSHLLMISRLLKTLYQGNTVPQSMWKEFVQQLRQWMAKNWEKLGPLHDIENIHRLPDLLLEDADFPPELRVNPQSTT